MATIDPDNEVLQVGQKRMKRIKKQAKIEVTHFKKEVFEGVELQLKSRKCSKTRLQMFKASMGITTETDGFQDENSQPRRPNLDEKDVNVND